jgi:hypothetical protein
MTNLTRILSEAVGSWLHFEFNCNRSGLFNEKYLSFPLGQVLSARLGGRVHAEFTHPVLAALMNGRGRRPQVDFAYCEHWPRRTIAVETKWIGKTKVTVEDIIWDLIRLEMIAHESGATCIFVLGGKRRHLELLFKTAAFSGGRGAGHRRPILNTKSNSQYDLWLVPHDHYRIPMLRKLFANLQEVPMPHSLSTIRTAPFPLDPPKAHYQVYSWMVCTSTHRQTFLPGANKHYKTMPNTYA